MFQKVSLINENSISHRITKMGEKQEIGLLLNEVSSKENQMEISISDSIETYTDILSKKSHKDILKWMKDKDLGKFMLYWS